MWTASGYADADRLWLGGPPLYADHCHASGAAGEAGMFLGILGRR